VLVGGVFAAAVGGTTPPSRAEDVSARDELVAREAPGKTEAGIAVLRGSERLRLLGERDGWSEVLLADGRRAWVPSVDLVHPSAPPTPGVEAIASATPEAPIAADPVPMAQASLGVEIARLRALVDELAANARERTESPPRPTLPADTAPLVGGVAFVVGLLVGGAWERHRARRERSLRF